MLDCTLTTDAQEACHELIALRGTVLSALSGLPVEPGSVRRSADRAELLHFAPGRWLVPAPGEALLSELARLESAALVDVEGKWRRVLLSGADAARVLSAGIPVESMLSGRDCAATTVFDCPVVIGRASQGFEIWVLSSYAASFCASVEAVSRRGQ